MNGVADIFHSAATSAIKIQGGGYPEGLLHRGDKEASFCVHFSCSIDVNINLSHLL